MAEQILPAEQQFPMSGSMTQVIRVFGDLCFHTDGDIQLLAFAPDAKLLSIEDLGVLRTWDPGTGQQLRWTFLSDLETLWAVSPEANLIASATDDLTGKSPPGKFSTRFRSLPGSRPSCSDPRATCWPPAMTTGSFASGM
jgi:WD40 repeat protein